MATARCSDGVLPRSSEDQCCGDREPTVLRISGTRGHGGLRERGGCTGDSLFFCSGMMCETRKKKKAQIQRQMKLQSYGRISKSMPRRQRPCPRPRAPAMKTSLSSMDSSSMPLLGLRIQLGLVCAT
ncbi:hypothetical protein VPH35_137555 [Triticum aestivum]|uniref:uncharacterized protein isoform X1 n=1 Tax=Triticum aestivum TaxID=4565 RepID=UPI001D01A411|nr:uncharacterized protein LOC123165489 isoform X1 [Triticum aestivum]